MSCMNSDIISYNSAHLIGVCEDKWCILYVRFVQNLCVCSVFKSPNNVLYFQLAIYCLIVKFSIIVFCVRKYFYFFSSMNAIFNCNEFQNRFCSSLDCFLRNVKWVFMYNFLYSSLY